MTTREMEPVGTELVGATILAVSSRPNDWPPGRDFLRLHVRFASDVEVNGANEAYYELWSDEEGNGPGELVYLGENPDEKEGGDV